MHSGRNIGKVMTFFTKLEPTLRALRVNISNKKITKLVECNYLFSLHVYDYEHANLCSLHLVYVIWFHHNKLEKPYLVA